MVSPGWQHTVLYTCTVKPEEDLYIANHCLLMNSAYTCRSNVYTCIEGTFSGSIECPLNTGLAVYTSVADSMGA
jgi:hypothetical protein